MGQFHSQVDGTYLLEATSHLGLKLKKSARLVEVYHGSSTLLSKRRIWMGRSGLPDNSEFFRGVFVRDVAGSYQEKTALTSHAKRFPLAGSAHLPCHTCRNGPIFLFFPLFSTLRKWRRVRKALSRFRMS
jgi:hypothetical protein